MGLISSVLIRDVSARNQCWPHRLNSVASVQLLVSQSALYLTKSAVNGSQHPHSQPGHFSRESGKLQPISLRVRFSFGRLSAGGQTGRAQNRRRRVLLDRGACEHEQRRSIRDTSAKHSLLQALLFLAGGRAGSACILASSSPMMAEKKGLGDVPVPRREVPPLLAQAEITLRV